MFSILFVAYQVSVKMISDEFKFLKYVEVRFSIMLIGGNSLYGNIAKTLLIKQKDHEIFFKICWNKPDYYN